MKALALTRAVLAAVIILALSAALAFAAISLALTAMRFVMLWGR